MRKLLIIDLESCPECSGMFRITVSYPTVHCSTVDLIYAGITYKAVAVFFRDQLRVQCLPFSVFFLICFDKCANKEVVYKMDIFIYMCVYTKSK